MAGRRSETGAAESKRRWGQLTGRRLISSARRIKSKLIILFPFFVDESKTARPTDETARRELLERVLFRSLKAVCDDFFEFWPVVWDLILSEGVK